MDNLRARRKTLDVTGYSVVEASAEGDEQVCLLQRGNRRNGSVHARHT